MNKGIFIAFEGIDGSGKSTQVKLLTNKLKENGYKVYSTFEPTDSPIGSIIRNVFNHRIIADNRTIAGLFVADRLDHLLNETNGILKKIEEGYIVITDRYYFSSYAYHGVHMPMDWVINSNSMSSDLLKPTINIYVDICPDESMSRITKDRSLIELYENKEYLKEVREKYFEAFEKLKEQENISIIDGNRKPEIILDEIWSQVKSLLG
ncbi:dTMP kinase [Flavobacterium collinsii]|uniref:Thymidylate kinase n=1 Tax=Flavobacterium collinsii TaxID=1114861 RepID=A0ABM8KQC3_9FLAO|nr:dTMP kinase [Flavobacterium collinsii]CAA9203484.1 Thymidylate kinase [Flavobacterium collinsii]